MPGGDGFTSAFSDFGRRTGVDPVKGGSVQPSAARLLVSMGTGSRSILPSGQRGGRGGGEEVAATFPGDCSRAALGFACQPALISWGTEICCGL